MPRIWEGIVGPLVNGGHVGGYDGYDVWEYIKESKDLRPLYERAGVPPLGAWAGYNCWYNREEMDSGLYVSICDHYNLLMDKARDFSETGKCNFYTIEETFFATPSVMAFQVGNPVSHTHMFCYCACFFNKNGVDW